MPIYNEEKTLEQVVSKVMEVDFSEFFDEIELVMVNDGSKDDSLKIMNQLKQDLETKKFSFLILDNEVNMGKSQTVRNGLMQTTGDYVVIQDADLEYDPEDIYLMAQKLFTEDADVAYGNRFGRKNKVIYIKNYVGNIGLSFISNFFTFPRLGKYIPDMEVCYKLIRGDVARQLAEGIESKSNFGFEPEITAKLSRYKNEDGKRLKFVIVPIKYFPRSIEEGKKMKAFEDGLKALKEIIIFNLF